MVENPTSISHHVDGDRGLIKLIDRQTCIAALDRLYAAIQEAERQSVWMGYGEMERQCERMLIAWQIGADAVPVDPPNPTKEGD